MLSETANVMIDRTDTTMNGTTSNDVLSAAPHAVQTTPSAIIAIDLVIDTSDCEIPDNFPLRGVVGEFLTRIIEVLGETHKWRLVGKDMHGPGEECGFLVREYNGL